MAERETFQSAYAKPLTGKNLAKLLPAETATPAQYFSRLVGIARGRAEADDPASVRGYMFMILDALKDHLFDAGSGLFRNNSVCFLDGKGIPARCSSRVVPRTLQSVLPSIVKTDKESAKRANIEKLASCQTRDELEALTTEMRGAEWLAMPWHKPADRGIVICLQGVSESTHHHIWSCADRGGRHEDGRYFKEANVEGISWTLGELTEDLASVKTLICCVLMLGGV